MDEEYLNMTIQEIRTDVLVKGPEIVAEEMKISKSCVRELCPNESIRYDVKWEEDLNHLIDTLMSQDKQ